MKIAKRISHLGTETAFAVSAEAAAFSAKGNKVYPFHLGDLNIITPANIIEAAARAMHDGKTGYCPNAGVPKLREVLASTISRSHGVDYTMENVAIQPGGKPTISKFFMTLMNPGDEVLYPNPGSPFNVVLLHHPFSKNFSSRNMGTFFATFAFRLRLLGASGVLAKSR